MAAYGAELISVPAGKMELARDLAHEMQVLLGNLILQLQLERTLMSCFRGLPPS